LPMKYAVEITFPFSSANCSGCNICPTCGRPDAAGMRSTVIWERRNSPNETNVALSHAGERLGDARSTPASRIETPNNGHSGHMLRRNAGMRTSGTYAAQLRIERMNESKPTSIDSL